MFVGKMSSGKGKKIQALFHALLLEHRPTEPLQGPLQLQISYVYPWRKAETKKNKATGWMWKATKPDTDNMIKTPKDCMSDLGFWEDDNQVVQELTEKAWGDHYGIRIKIVQVDPFISPKWYKNERT